MARKGRVLTTAIAVLLGVAFVTGTLVLSDTITRVFNDLFADVNEGTDAVVRAESTFDDGFGTDIRGRIDQSLLGTVLATPGVDDADGQVQGFAQYVGADGEAIGNPGQGAPTLGFSWPEVEQLNPFVLVDGERPRGPNQVAMDKKTADDEGYEVGDTVEVLTQQEPQEFTISGITRFGSADSPAGATVALFDLPTAQAIIAEPGKFDSISVVAADGVSQEQLAEDLRAALPTDQSVEVITGDELVEETQDAIADQLSFFTTFLLVFAVIAVIVGAFVIYNTFGILIAQRSRELALLRAVGASRRQVISSVLVEAGFVALVGSILGLIGGVILASLLRSGLNALGFELPDGSLIIAARTIVIGLVLGFVVTAARRALPRAPRLADPTGGRHARGGPRRLGSVPGPRPRRPPDHHRRRAAAGSRAVRGRRQRPAVGGHRRRSGLPGHHRARTDPRRPVRRRHRLADRPLPGHHGTPGPGEHRAQPQAHVVDGRRPHDRRRPGRAHRHRRRVGDRVDQPGHRRVLHGRLRRRLRVVRLRRPQPHPGRRPQRAARGRGRHRRPLRHRPDRRVRRGALRRRPGRPRSTSSTSASSPARPTASTRTASPSTRSGPSATAWPSGIPCPCSSPRPASRSSRWR